MGPNIIPEYRKQYKMNGINDLEQIKKELAEAREKLIIRMLELPAIVARNCYDFLVKIEKKDEKPIAIWNKELIETLSLDELLIAVPFLERRQAGN